jgi:hypothetical protein
MDMNAHHLWAHVSFLLPLPPFHGELELLLFRKIFFLETVARAPECDESFSKLNTIEKS